jgi:hypothetical protein
LEFDEGSGQKEAIKGRGASHSILEIERVSPSKNKILGDLFQLELFKEQFNKRFGDIPDEIEFGPSAQLPPEKKPPTDLAFHQVDQRRNAWILSKMANLPEPGASNGIHAVGFPHLFQEDPV